MMLMTLRFEDYDSCSSQGGDIVVTTASDWILVNPEVRTFSRVVYSDAESRSSLLQALANSDNVSPKGNIGRFLQVG